MSVPNRFRLVAVLFFGLAATAFFYMIRISGWEREADGTRFLVPDSGGRQFVEGRILELLGQYGGIAAGIGVALLVAAQIYAVRMRRAVAEGRPFPPSRKASPVQVVLLVVFALAVGLAGTFGYRWYDYVFNARSPYDEVGIAIVSRLPEPARAWSCGKLRERFARQLPPYGCQDGTGRGWR